MKWLATLVISLALALPVAQGQSTDNTRPEQETPEKVPGVQYIVATLFTMLVLVIVCMPSRKSATD